MISCTKVQFRFESFEQSFPEIRGEFRVSVGHNRFRNSVQSCHFFYENISNICCLVSGIKWAAFVSLSTTTMIESCSLHVRGNHVIKSIVTTSHFHSGMGKGCINPAGCLCLALTFWHSIHLAMYSTISLFIPGQK
jgi:hypothetical protein